MIGCWLCQYITKHKNDVIIFFKVTICRNQNNDDFFIHLMKLTHQPRQWNFQIIIPTNADDKFLDTSAAKSDIENLECVDIFVEDPQSVIDDPIFYGPFRSSRFFLCAENCPARNHRKRCLYLVRFSDDGWPIDFQIHRSEEDDSGSESRKWSWQKIWV